MSGNGAAVLPPSNPSPYLTRSTVEYFYLLLIWIHLLQPLVPTSFSTQYLLSLQTLKHCYLQTPSFSLTHVRDDALSGWRPTICSYSKYPVVTFWTLPSTSLPSHGSQNDSNYFRIVLPRYTGTEADKSSLPAPIPIYTNKYCITVLHWQLVASC